LNFKGIFKKLQRNANIITDINISDEPSPDKKRRHVRVVNFDPQKSIGQQTPDGQSKYISCRKLKNSSPYTA